MATSLSLIRPTMTTNSTLFSKLLRSTHSPRSMPAPYTSRSLKTMVPLHYPNAENSNHFTEIRFKIDVNMQSLLDRGKVLLAKLKETVNNNYLPSAELMDAFSWHPFLRKGPQCPFDIEGDEDNMYARIDMPGVGKEGVKVWMEKDELHFKGEVVEKNPENGNVEFVREFSSSIHIPPGGYETDKVKYVVKNGIVRIVVPKLIKIGDIGTFSQVKVEF